ncbi:PAAR domain-containing protein [Desulfovibrio sp. 6_1_46AFAA]|uniref:PAAR domain-containing protein n=1 Tax=Desulfovibrio sp. 6_1_46AFAA TaxID=665942 RepID=UPI0009FFBE59|nr:PAAR domain-containing protein [Desulfovibrio sp. 6_1_46AFAA]
MSCSIDNRGIIRLGDSTTHGGTVVQVASTTTVDGIRIARIGDIVTCPKCKGIYSIVEGQATYTDQGVPVALHGHKTSCGAALITSLP